MKNLIPVNPTVLITRTSKIEGNVVIYGGETYLFKHDYIQSMTDAEKVELLKCLVFRRMIGTVDTCPRNLIYYNGRVITIDDPVMSRICDGWYKTVLNAKWQSVYDAMFAQFANEVNEFKRRMIQVLKEYSLPNCWVEE